MPPQRRRREARGSKSPAIPLSALRSSATACLLCIVSFASPSLAQSAAAPGTALATLTEMLSDPKRCTPTVIALQGTGDPNVAPLLAAMTRSGDAKRRAYGVTAAAALLDKAAAPILLERLRGDSDMDIRADAAARLIALDAIGTEDLAAALASPDERVQCLAARALAVKGQLAAARPVLARLTASKVPSTACLSRTCLLGLGDRDQLEPIRAAVREAKASPAVVGLIVRQVEDQKIAAAMALVLEVAGNEDSPLPLRVQAYAAAAKLSSAAAVAIRDAIADSRSTVFRVQLLKLLAEADAGGEHLKAVATGGDAAAALARFELARRAGGAQASAAAGAALALEHPIAVAYVLDRAGEDIKARGAAAEFYVPAFVGYIRSVDPKPAEMQREHFFAAAAAARLLELGTPRALSALRELLGGKTTAVTRAVAAGLLRARNPAACELMLPLLSNAYPELATDAALALGHFGRREGRAALADIVANPQRSPPALVVLASWYVLKIDGQTKQAAGELAKLIK